MPPSFLVIALLSSLHYDRKNSALYWSFPPSETLDVPVRRRARSRFLSHISTTRVAVASAASSPLTVSCQTGLLNHGGCAHSLADRTPVELLTPLVLLTPLILWVIHVEQAALMARAGLEAVSCHHPAPYFLFSRRANRPSDSWSAALTNIVSWFNQRTERDVSPCLV